MARDVFRQFPAGHDLIGLVKDKPGRAAQDILDDFWEAAGAAPRIVTATMFGGAILGGAAVRARARAAAASGGVVAGGSAGASRARQFSASGGAVLGGGADAQRAGTIAPDGGAVLGGASAAARVRCAESAGGVVAGGYADATRAVAVEAAGGVVFGGAASASTEPARVSATMDGGVVLGGAAGASMRTPGPGPVDLCNAYFADGYWPAGFWSEYWPPCIEAVAAVAGKGGFVSREDPWLLEDDDLLLIVQAFVTVMAERRIREIA